MVMARVATERTLLLGRGRLRRLGSRFFTGVLLAFRTLRFLKTRPLTFPARLTKARYESAFDGTSQRRPDFVKSSRRTPRLRSIRSQDSPRSSARRSPVLSARATAADRSLFLDFPHAPNSLAISSSMSHQAALRLL